MSENYLSPERRAEIEKMCAPGPEELDPKNAIKVVFIFEGFAPNARDAWLEMCDIATGYGMTIQDVIIEKEKFWGRS